jgi:hypothetical protein
MTPRRIAAALLVVGKNEILDKGEVPRPLSPGAAAFEASARAFLARFRPRFVAVEATVFNRRVGYAGTADFVAGIGPVTVIGDYKSGRSVHDEVAMQLAALAHGEEIVTPDGRRHPVPVVDGGGGGPRATGGLRRQAGQDRRATVAGVPGARGRMARAPARDRVGGPGRRGTGGARRGARKDGPGGERITARSSVRHGGGGAPAHGAFRIVQGPGVPARPSRAGTGTAGASRRDGAAGRWSFCHLGRRITARIDQSRLELVADRPSLGRPAARREASAPPTRGGLLPRRLAVDRLEQQRHLDQVPPRGVEDSSASRPRIRSDRMPDRVFAGIQDKSRYVLAIVPSLL